MFALVTAEKVLCSNSLQLTHWHQFNDSSPLLSLLIKDLTAFNRTNSAIIVAQHIQKKFIFLIKDEPAISWWRVQLQYNPAVFAPLNIRKRIIFRIALKNFFKNNKKKNLDSIITVSRWKNGRRNRFDYTMFDKIPKQSLKPLIFLDRAGNYSHFVEALQKNIIHSVTTANSLNFAGNDLQEARELVGN